MIVPLWPWLLLALIAPTLAEVPVGCVEIKNRAINKFLVQSSTYDKDRRHVSYSPNAEQWVIAKDGENYRITHGELKEELYESELYKGGNYVFTWIPKNKVDGGVWSITKSGNEFFQIKNAKLGHCLWTKGGFGWIGAYANCDTTQYQWKITTVECKDK